MAAEILDNSERLTVLKDHLKNVQSELVHAQEVAEAKKR